MIINGSIPLCIDLDGTFIQQDVTRIAFKKVVQQQWLCLFKVLYWLVKGGKSNVKFQLAQRYNLKPTDFSLNPELYQFLCHQHAQGRRLILATGANELHAQMVVQLYPFFTNSVASTQNFNCIGHNKAQLLTNTYGFKGFDYAGNSNQDLAVWKACRMPIAVNCSLALLKKVCKIFGEHIQQFDQLYKEKKQ